MSFTLPIIIYDVKVFSHAAYIMRIFYPIFIYNKHISIQNYRNLYIETDHYIETDIREKMLYVPWSSFQKTILKYIIKMLSRYLKIISFPINIG